MVKDINRERSIAIKEYVDGKYEKHVKTKTIDGEIVDGTVYYKRRIEK